MTGLFLLVKQMLDLTPALSGNFSRAGEVLVEETLYVEKTTAKKHQMSPFFRYDATIWPHVGLARGCATSRTGARS